MRADKMLQHLRRGRIWSGRENHLQVSLDAVGKARDEDDESEENLLESAEETEDVDEESEDTADAQDGSWERFAASV